MKRILGLVVTLAMLSLVRGALAGAFTPGDIVVYRIGDGTQPVTNIGQTVWLDEYTPAAISNAAGSFSSPVPVQSIMMPTNWYGSSAPLISEGPETAGGQMTLSQDGRFLVLTGYGATLSSGASQTYQITNTSLSGSTVTGLFNQVARVVGLVDGNGHIYTTTVQTNGNEEGDDIRAAASPDGTNIWLGGSANRVKYTTRGSGISTQVCSDTSLSPLRAVNIFGNKLYIDKAAELATPTNMAAGVNLAGTTLPTNSISPNFVSVPGVYGSGSGAAGGLAMFTMNGGTNPDTLYLADSQTNAPGLPPGRGGSILKYCFITSSNTWVYEGQIEAEDVYGVTGIKNGSNVILYATEGTNQTLFTYTDTYGFDTSGHGGQIPNDGSQYCLAEFGVGSTNIANPLLINLRGISVVPQGGDSGSISGPGVITVGPPFGPYFTGPAGGPFSPSSYTYSVANLGTTVTNWTLNFSNFGSLTTWLTASATSGTLSPGASTTVTITPNANANSLSGGFSYTGKANIHDGGVGVNPPAAALSATMVVYAFFITPSSNYIAQGAVGGPFMPSSYSYVISNATLGALQWSAGTSNNWTSVSPTGTLLAATSATTVTVSINSNANGLVIGSYEDTLTFSNVTAGTQLSTRGITLQTGFGIFDDFGSSSFMNGNVVGQNNWLGNTDTSINYVQITNGLYVVPGGCVNASGTSQQPYKYVAAQQITNSASYSIMGMSITFTNGSPSPNYIFTIGTTFLTLDNAGIEDIGGGQYVWTTQLNSYNSTPTIGSIPYYYYTNYLVFLVTDNVDSNAWVFVNPGTNDFNVLTNEVPAVYTDGSNCSYCPGVSPGFNSISLGQYSNCGLNEQQQGYFVSKVAASTNYTDVYNFLSGATNTPPPTDPFTTWQDHYFPTELGTPSFSGPNADPFGKGMSNTNQFLAGFNPTNAAAYLHITAISKTNSGTDVRVDFLGASGDSTYTGGPASRTNVLEFTAGSSGSYKSNNFASTGVTNILSGGTGLGTLANMVDPGGATNKPSRYYRVRVLVP